jgi:hypothetical protein
MISFIFEASFPQTLAILWDQSLVQSYDVMDKYNFECAESNMHLQHHDTVAYYYAGLRISVTM